MYLKSLCIFFISLLFFKFPTFKEKLYCKQSTFEMSRAQVHHLTLLPDDTCGLPGPCHPLRFSAPTIPVTHQSSVWVPLYPLDMSISTKGPAPPTSSRDISLFSAKSACSSFPTGVCLGLIWRPLSPLPDSQHTPAACIWTPLSTQKHKMQQLVITTRSLAGDCHYVLTNSLVFATIIQKGD